MRKLRTFFCILVMFCITCTVYFKVKDIFQVQSHTKTTEIDQSNKVSSLTTEVNNVSEATKPTDNAVSIRTIEPNQVVLSVFPVPSNSLKNSDLLKYDDFDKGQVSNEPYEKIQIDKTAKIRALKDFGLTDDHISVLRLDIKPRSKEIYYSNMHNLANSKIIAVDGKVAERQYIDNNKIIRMINEVMNSDSNDKQYILSILQRWFYKDFSQCVQEHNYFWTKLGGVEGKAIDLTDEAKAEVKRYNSNK